MVCIECPACLTEKEKDEEKLRLCAWNMYCCTSVNDVCDKGGIPMVYELCEIHYALRYIDAHMDHLSEI